MLLHPPSRYITIFGRFSLLALILFIPLFLRPMATLASPLDPQVALLETLQMEGLIPDAPPSLTANEHPLIPRPVAGDNFGYTVAVDGNTAVIAAPLDNEWATDSGAIYIFQYTGSAWVQQAKLVGGEGTVNQIAGGDEFGRSVAIDGDTVVVGAPFHEVGDPGAAYVFFRSGGVWAEQAVLLPGDPAGGDQFGLGVDVSGDTIVVGAPMNDDGGSNSGSAYVFTRSAGVWSEQAKLIASDDAAGDEFGHSVAIYTDTILVGAWRDDDGGSNTGSAYVFTRSAGVWTQQVKLNAGDRVIADTFANAMSLDGDTAVIGKVGDDGPNNSGAAYIFQGSGSSWTQQAKLKAADAGGFDQFGHSVSISSDRVVIGARGDDTVIGANAGSAYVFERNAGVWTQQARLNPSDAALGDEFGTGVAVSGSTIVVGAGLNDEDNGTDSGAAYGFTGSGTTWTEQGKFRGHNLQPYDNFGYSVSIDGDVAVVSTPYDNDYYEETGTAFIFERVGGVWQQTAEIVGSFIDYQDEFGCAAAVNGDTIAIGSRRTQAGDFTGPFSGAVHIFIKVGNTWLEQAKITPADVAGGDTFGCALSLKGDTLLATSAQDDDLGNNSGSAYVFRRSGGIWAQEAKLTAGDGAANDQFGRKAVLSDDGNTAVIGVPLDDGPGADSGAVYVFQYSGGVWMQQAKLTAGDATGGDQFGAGVGITGNSILIGSPLDDDGGSNRGAVYLFDWNGSSWTQTTKLYASDAGNGDQFGYALAVSGSTFLAASPTDDDGGTNAGAVYIWQRSDTGWVQQLKVRAGDPGINDQFGTAVSLSGDRLAVGVPFKDAVGINGGAAYVYEFQAANLSVYKSDFPDPVMVGTTLTYIITATNSGPSPALGAVITDTLPASVTLNNATSTQGSCVLTSPVVCTVGDLNVGDAVTVTIEVTPNLTGTIVNTAVIASTIFDYNTPNNTSAESTVVTDLPVHVYAAPDVPTCAGNTPCFTGSGNVQQAFDGVADNGLVTILGTNPVTMTVQTGNGGANNATMDGNGTLLWTGGAGSLLTIASDVVVDGVMMACSGSCVSSVALTGGGTGNLTLMNGMVDGFETAVSIAGNVVVKGNTFNNLTTVFAQSGGSLLAYANNITNFTLGLNSTGGSFNVRHNWWGVGATAVQVGDNAAFDFRLGAPVAGWGEGTLGGASLTTGGGTGSGVIVSHGRGHTNAPFGKATLADGNSQCSDYYDFFVVNGSGNWTITIPIDGDTGCDGTYNNAKLFAFALAGGAPDTACTPDTACWNLMTGVSPAPVDRALQVTVDANSFLQGTPLVAGNSNEEDPTAVHLSAFSAKTNQAVWVFVGLVFLSLLMGFVWRRK